jgi:tetratricopeptide (TPR) repeat protein
VGKTRLCLRSVLAVLLCTAAGAAANDGLQASSQKGPLSKDRTVQKEDATADPNLTGRVKDYVSKQLWKSRISTLPADSTAGRQEKDDLDLLVDRLKAAETKVKPRGHAAAEGGRTLRPADPNAAAAASPAPAPTSVTPARSSGADANPAAAATLTLPEGLDPNTATDPFKIAEILYAAGLRSKAAPYYQRALAQLDPQDKKKASERQWILLQLGRCWREDQPAQARQMFSQLISEYPDSPWLNVARTWQGLTDWYLTEQPRQFIQRSASSAPQPSRGSESTVQP